MTIRMRRTIAVYEMLTFVATLVNVVFAYAVMAHVPRLIYIVGALATVVAAISLLAGIWLWQDRPGGRLLSLWIQVVQIPQLVLDGLVGYGLGLGISIVVGVGAKPAGLEPPVHLLVTTGSDAVGFFLGVNVLALIAAVLLARGSAAQSQPDKLPAKAA